MRWCAGAAVLALVLLPGVAFAQAAESARFEVSGGLRWFGPSGFGTVAANQTVLGGGTRRVFSSDTTLDGSMGAGTSVSYRVARAVRVEAAVAYNPTGLSTRLSGDVEGVANTVARAPVTQFLFEGGLLAAGRRRGPVTPFVTGGAGYLRQLNDGRTLVETGRSYYAGAGLYYVRASAHPRRVKAIGARVDLRAVFLRDGVAPDSTIRGVPAVTAALFARF